MEFWDFLQSWGVYAPVLLYVWIAAAVVVAYRRTRQAYWLTPLPFGVLGVTYALLFPRVFEPDEVLDLPYVVALAFPLGIVIQYVLSSVVSSWGGTYHRPVSPHMLDVLLFRRPRPTGKLPEPPPGLRHETVLEPRKDLPLVVTMACAVFVCFLVSYSSRGLGFCQWLDVALERSGCIRQLSFGTYVEEVAYSPDGRLLAAGGIGHVVKIWSTRDWHLVRTLSEPTDWVENLAFSPDGKTLATWSEDDKLRMWGVEDGRLIRVLEPGAGEDVYSFSSLLYSPDGTTIAFTGEPSPDTDAVWLWNAQDGTLIRRISAFAHQIAFSPDGKLLAHVEGHREIALHRISDGVVVRRLPLPTGQLLDLYYSPDGSQLAVLSDRRVHFIMSTDGTVVRTLDLGEEYTRDSALSSDWKYVAAPTEKFNVAGRYNKTVSLGLWQLSPDRLVSRWPVGDSTVSGIAYAPDNTTLATGLGYDLIRIWRLPRP
ncbi:MAG TPA: hypothetical protein VFH60_05340 [Chloroflexia bacterium]|nr:hypothetical protein [Chloroflexia bacterium]